MFIYSNYAWVLIGVCIGQKAALCANVKRSAKELISIFSQYSFACNNTLLVGTYKYKAGSIGVPG